MKKRILSFLLALTLLVGLCPAVYAATGFADVHEGDWFYAPVQWAVENGITGGIGNNRFGPNAPCTRGQVVTFLHAAAGRPEPTALHNPFEDVSDGDYFYKAVIWAVQEGITGGTSPTTFSPNDPCTRGQVVTFLHAAAGRPAPTAASADFTDIGSADWFYTPVLWAVENGITGGIGNNLFGPNSTCTRGQIVTFLHAARNAPSVPDDDLTEDFEAMDIHDFPAHLVINFDEDETTKFGVLNENVIRWEDKAITAEKIHDGALTKYIFSSAEPLQEVPIGSVIYVRSPKGTPYLVSVGAVAGSVVTTDPDLPLSAYYTYLDAAIVSTIDTAAMQRSGSGSASRSTYAASPAGKGITFTPNYENGITIGGVMDGEHFSLGMTGSITAKTDGHIHYSVVHFGRDYIDFMMESTVSMSAGVTGSVKASKNLHSLNEDLEVGEVPLLTVVPGLDLTLEMKLPISLDAKVGFTSTLTLAKTERVEYQNTFEKPLHSTVEETNDVTTDCKGEVTLKAGIAAEIGMDFLDDLLELVLELKVFGGIRCTPELPKHEFTGDPKAVHMCDLCIKGELFAEVSGEIKFQANISEKTKLELVTITLLKLEIPIDAFYISMESPADSIHKGEITFGLGTCPNQKHRVGFVTKMIDGTLLPESYVVELTKEGDPTVNVCVSTEYAYLYDGNYAAAMDLGEKMGKSVSFTVKGFPMDVTLYAPVGNEKQIYTNYLLNGGYYDLTHTNFYYEYNASIKTVCIDLNADGTQELLLQYTDNNVTATNSLKTYTGLYTIDEDSGEVVCIASYNNSSAATGSTQLSFLRNAATDEHHLMLQTSTQFDGTGKNKTSEATVQHWDGERLVPGDSFRVDQYLYPCEDERYAEAVESILQGPYTAYDYSTTITAYFVNGVQVTKEDYNAAYSPARVTDSRYQWYYGTYREPIK